MNINAPKKATFWISVVLGLLGLLGQVGVLAVFAPYAFWLVFVGMVVLVLGNMVKGM